MRASSPGLARRGTRKCGGARAWEPGRARCQSRRSAGQSRRPDRRSRSPPGCPASPGSSIASHSCPIASHSCSIAARTGPIVSPTWPIVSPTSVFASLSSVIACFARRAPRSPQNEGDRRDFASGSRTPLPQKVSGTRDPSKANQERFNRAVEAVTRVTRELLDGMEVHAPPKDRAEEAAKAKARSIRRVGNVG